LIIEQIRRKENRQSCPAMNKTALLITVILVLIFVGSALGQPEVNTALPPDYISFAPKPPEDIISLDQPIDPLTYVLGPGDKMMIFFWGSLQAQYSLTVTPEGKLLIPTVGPVNVSGVFLSAAKTIIEEKILEKYKNIEVTADLIGLRSFKVSIGGAVQFPGIYTANGTTRISEIIAMAGGFVVDPDFRPARKDNKSPVTLPSGTASHRNIILRQTTGNIDTADVLLFEQTGDLRHNYKLTDGDEIFVPLQNPAYFEYSPRDSLTDLINLAHGLTLDADSSIAELVRFAPDGITVIRMVIELKDILTGQSPDIRMMPDDRLYVKTFNRFNIKHQVLILGEVEFPGFYAIEPESTYLSQVLVEAGGFTSLASLTEAEMSRFTDRKVADREFQRLQLMEISDMSDLEYEYFKVKSREEPGRVSVNFQNLYNSDSGTDIKLRNGDVIVIPTASEVIKVVGEVANPGLLGYDPEYNYRDYVELAGGYSFRANKGKVRIIKGVTGEWKKAKRNMILRPGDTILIPEKKKRNYFNTLRDVIAFTANVATVYLVIREATK